MKKIWLIVVASVVLAIWLWNRRPAQQNSSGRQAAPQQAAGHLQSSPGPVTDSDAQSEEHAGVTPQTEMIAAEAKSASPGPSRPTQTNAPPPQQAQSEPNPYHLDPFKLRKLDQPLPKSVADLRSKLTEFASPELPDPVARGANFDGDVLTGYRGYFRTSSGEFKRIQVDRSSDMLTISLEISEGRLTSWSYNYGANKLKQFNGDPYSMVVVLPDRRMLYLKFYTDVNIPEIDHPVRTMKGWLIHKQNAKVHSAPVAMFDYHLKDIEDVWPKRETIQDLLPAELAPGP